MTDMIEFKILDDETPLQKIPLEIRKLFGSAKYQLQVLYGAIEVYELVCQKYNLAFYPNKSHIHMSSARSVVHELSIFMKLANSLCRHNKETNKAYDEYLESNASIKDVRDSLAHYYERVNKAPKSTKINTIKLADGKFTIINRDGLSYSSIKLSFELYQDAKILIKKYYTAIVEGTD